MVTYRVDIGKAKRLVDLKIARLELDRLNSFHRTTQRDQELQQLSQATGLRDSELVERLHQAGFHAQNIDALQWLPVALVAWASDGVSPAEIEATKLLHLHAQTTDKPAAVRLFQSWLDQRPSKELLSLWEDTTRALGAIQPAELHAQTGQMILEIGKRVARASGGFLGIGEVCAAERELLDRIFRVYGL